jgi:hypothetical protein
MASCCPPGPAGEVERSAPLGKELPIELDLPQTGVCSSSLVPEEPVACCGGPAPATINACCARDAEAKGAGLAGCGCLAPASDDARRAR